MAKHRGQTQCCDDDCGIASDNFNRADDEDPGEDWTGHPDTGEIAGGALLMTTARTFITHNTPHPDGVGGKSRVNVLVIPTVSGGDVQARACVAVLDDDNYAFAAIFEGDTECPWFRLGVRIDGTDSWVSEERPLPPRSTWPAGWPLYVCWRAGEEGGTGDTVQTGGYASVFSDTDEDWNAPEESLGAPDMDYAQISGKTSVTESWSGFGLAIPAGSIIDGIVVTLYGFGDQDSGMNAPTIENVRLIKPSVGVVGDDKGTGAEISNPGYGSVDYGSNVDDWSAGLTAEDLNDADFAVAFTFAGITTNMYIDAVEVTVYYRPVAEGVPGMLSAHVGTGPSWPNKIYLEADVDAAIGGASVGLEYAAGAGSVKFDDFVFKHHKEEEAHTNCPECRPPCEFFSDDAPEEGCHWTEETSGLISKHYNPQASEGTRIVVKFTPDTETDEGSVLIDWVDDDNYHRIEVAFDGTDGTLTIYRSEDGTEEEVDSVVVTDEVEIIIEVCFFSSGSIIASSQLEQLLVFSKPLGGSRFGLVGNGTFTDFTASSLAAECPDCTGPLWSCYPCAENTLPGHLAVRFSGVQDDNCDASVINNKWFIVPLQGCIDPVPVAFDLDICDEGERHYGDEDFGNYQLNFDIGSSVFEDCDDINILTIIAYIYRRDATNQYRIHVALLTQNNSILLQPADDYLFRGTFAEQDTAPDCLQAIEGVPLSYICNASISLGGPANAFDMSAAVVTVSAV